MTHLYVDCMSRHSFRRPISTFSETCTSLPHVLCKFYWSSDRFLCSGHAPFVASLRHATARSLNRNGGNQHYMATEIFEFVLYSDIDSGQCTYIGTMQECKCTPRLHALHGCLRLVMPVFIGNAMHWGCPFTMLLFCNVRKCNQRRANLLRFTHLFFENKCHCPLL
jgi:hypothetical protein